MSASSRCTPGHERAGNPGVPAESYGTPVSPHVISPVIAQITAETLASQNRPLEAMYPVVFFDALRGSSHWTPS
jgi:hypothetical protein